VGTSTPSSDVGSGSYVYSQIANCHADFPSDAPTRLKKELNTVLTLQGQLDIVDKSLQDTKDVIAKSVSTRYSVDLISSLEHTHDCLKQKVEALYASLNIHDTIPELQGVNLEFVRTLLMARDLKINIRKCAIGSFFEWDKLDRAVGRRDETLGDTSLTTDIFFETDNSPRYETSSVYTQSYFPTQACTHDCDSQIQQVL
jgi:hypothetical protein